MTIPLWTLLIAALLPYVWFTLANPLRKQEFGTLDKRTACFALATVCALALFLVAAHVF